MAAEKTIGIRPIHVTHTHITAELLSRFHTYIFTDIGNSGFMYKNQLQEYAQKAGLPVPIYESTLEGLSHVPMFRCKVIFNGVCYEPKLAYHKLKAAQCEAAQLALEAITKNGGPQTAPPGSMLETGLCKNLLQQYAQKKKIPLPVYDCHSTGEVHAVLHNCSVTIDGSVYYGGASRTKKEAEVKAARVALLSLLPSSPSTGTAPTPVSCTESIYSQLIDPKRRRLTGPIGTCENESTALKEEQIVKEGQAESASKEEALVVKKEEVESALKEEPVVKEGEVESILKEDRMVKEEQAENSLKEEHVVKEEPTQNNDTEVVPVSQNLASETC